MDERLFTLLDAPTMGLLAARRAEKTVLRLQEELIDRGPEYVHVTFRTAERIRDENAERRNSLEEKARGNIAAITISSSFVFSGLALVTGHPLGSAFFLFGLPFWFFSIAAYATVRVLTVGRVFTLDWKGEDSLDSNSLKLWYVERNEKTNTVKANWLTVSYNALRWAIVSLFFCSLWFLVDSHKSLAKATITVAPVYTPHVSPPSPSRLLHSPTEIEPQSPPSPPPNPRRTLAIPSETSPPKRPTQ